MSQNEKVVPLAPDEFEHHLEQLAHSILDGGITYDFVLVLERGANQPWSYLREVIPHRMAIHVDVTRYPDGETQSRQAPEFRSFPDRLSGVGLVIDDCVDDADTMYETVTRALQVGAAQVDTAAVLCKTANIKVKDVDTNKPWHPKFVGWDDAPGNIFFDFPREAFAKRVRMARQQPTTV